MVAERFKSFATDIWQKARRTVRRFGYDAVSPKNRRKAPSGVLQSEDDELTPDKRRKLISGSRELQRNFSIAAWMIRKHLDYVSTFSFQAKTGNDALDDRLEGLIGNYGKAENCDVAARHPLRRMIRLAEARRTVDGDMGIVKIRDGRLQALEGDRIRNPALGGSILGGSDIPLGDFTHGVETDDAGRALRYSVCRRGGLAGLSSGAFTFERTIPAANLILHAHFDRFDQVRGISPLAAAMNDLRDVYESTGYALMKMKVAQLFGLVFHRDADSSADSSELGTVTENAPDEDGETPTGYTVDFGKGPLVLDLDPGDDAKFLENKTPSIEFQAFIQVAISLSLKSLDIPFSFYDESFTNYSGARAARLDYEHSAAIKREDIQNVLDHITAWRLGLFIQDGLLPDVDPLALKWQWVHRGIPWIDPLKEVTADIMAIDAGLDNAEDVCQRNGKNVWDNIDKTARVRKYAADREVPLMTKALPVLPADEPQPTKKAA